MPYQTHRMPSGFTAAQQQALDAFEESRQIWDIGCIGTCRKEQNAKALVADWQKLLALDLTKSLIDAEKSSVRAALSYLGCRTDLVK